MKFVYSNKEETKKTIGGKNKKMKKTKNYVQLGARYKKNGRIAKAENYSMEEFRKAITMYWEPPLQQIKISLLDRVFNTKTYKKYLRRKTLITEINAEEETINNVMKTILLLIENDEFGK